MPELSVNTRVVANLTEKELQKAADLCPFGAIDLVGNVLSISPACRFCRICVNSGPPGLFEYIIDDRPPSAVSEWHGIAVYIEITASGVHPVSMELLGKARELADKSGGKITALVIGSGADIAAAEAAAFGADHVYVYDHHNFKERLIEPYAAAFGDFINKTKPAAVLVGATIWGRSLAPRVAARFRTGLTADCTELNISEEGGLVQIRPTFGGNIMARIITPNNRPQMATVRYRVFNLPARKENTDPVITIAKIPEQCFNSRVRLVSLLKKEKKPDIADAGVIVACGRAFKAEKDLDMAYRLAELLGPDAAVACTRPLIEAGWFDATKQIGLSGRTVKPRLIITLGISGAVQFRAGMEKSDVIVAVNADKDAPVFGVCHFAVIGDIYAVVPALIKKLTENRSGKDGAYV